MASFQSIARSFVHSLASYHVFYIMIGVWHWFFYGLCCFSLFHIKLQTIVINMGIVRMKPKIEMNKKNCELMNTMFVCFHVIVVVEFSFSFVILRKYLKFICSPLQCNFLSIVWNQWRWFILIFLLLPLPCVSREKKSKRWNFVFVCERNTNCGRSIPFRVKVHSKSWYYKKYFSTNDNWLLVLQVTKFNTTAIQTSHFSASSSINFIDPLIIPINKKQIQNELETTDLFFFFNFLLLKVFFCSVHLIFIQFDVYKIIWVIQFTTQNLILI